MASTQLSFISSNYRPLNAVSKEGAKDLLLEEICEYLPITPADVENWELNPNTDVPLFINTIGAWSNRPRPKTKIKNLYLAGDYVKNAIDLACMEGAVSAALEAAAQILERPRRDRIASGCSDPTGVAAGIAGVRPHPDDPRGGGGAGHRLARRKILTASAGRFGGPHQGNAEAANGFAPAAEAIASKTAAKPIEARQSSIYIYCHQQKLLVSGASHRIIDFCFSHGS